MADDQKDKIVNQDALPALSKVPENTKAGAIFKEGMTSQQVTHEKKVGDIRAQLEALKELQKINPTPERNEQIMKLDRQWGRNSRFTYLHNRGTPEQKKILEKRETLEDLKASDVLMLKKKGADLANLLLVSDSNPTNSVTRDATKEGDKFIVNFGDNKNINNVIGAADILPYDVSRVKINGVEGERKNFPRPGFYNVKTGIYLPVYDGDKMEVVKMGKIDEKSMKEVSEAEEKWLRENRIDDTIEDGGKALTDLPEDIELEKVAEEEKARRKMSGIDTSLESGIDNGENLKGEALWNDEKFQTKLTEVCERLQVKKDDMKVVMMAESGLNPKRENRTSHATGLIQFMPKTALGLKTTVGTLQRMTSIEQLDYVYKYFQPFAGKLKSPRDLYLATFYPAAMGRDLDFIFWSEHNAPASPERIASQNGIIAPGKNVITLADFHEYVDRKARA